MAALGSLQPRNNNKILREAFGYEGDLNPKFGYEGFRSDMGEIQAVRYSEIGGCCLDMGGISLLEIRL